MTSSLQFAKFMPALSLLIISIALLSEVVAPAHAQGPLPTPTPLPRIVATANAAQQAQAAAQVSLQQAAALRAQAAEIERNGQAQYAQAQADIAEAREAAAAQNGMATGEAIWRVESTLSQLRDTVAGQAGIVSALTAKTEAQAQTIVSLTNEVQNLRVDKVTIQAAYAAAVNQAEKVQAESATTSPIAWLVALAFMALCAVGLIVVLQRKATTVGSDDVIDTSYSVVSDDDEADEEQQD